MFPRKLGLWAQQERLWAVVKEVMLDGQYHSVSDLSKKLNQSIQSVGLGIKYAECHGLVTARRSAIIKPTGYRVWEYRIIKEDESR